MLAGLQGAETPTLAGELAKWLAKEVTPLLVAADLQRPNAVTRCRWSATAGVASAEPGDGVGDPVKVAKDGVEKRPSAITTRSSSRRHRRRADEGASDIRKAMTSSTR